MSEVLERPAAPLAPEISLKDSGLRAYLPAILPIVGAFVMVLLRVQFGGARFISDGALIGFALVAYLTAAVFQLTNLYAPSSTAQRLGLWLASTGAFLNLSSWGVRWIAARDRELELLAQNGITDIPWFFRYIPFANLYDLSIAFAFGAAITTLVIARRRSMRFIGALALPLVCLILLLAIFIGSELTHLQPILDSYWRPIHVGVASLGYGVALVCFAAAVMYLLKDGVKPEAMALWSSIFALAVFATISKYSVLTGATYTASLYFVGETSRQAIPLRAEIPYVGWIIAGAGLLLLGAIAAFGKYLAQADERARRWGHGLLKLSLVAQGCAIITLVMQLKTIANPVPLIDRAQFPRFGTWLAEQDGLTPEQIAQVAPEQFVIAADRWVTTLGSRLTLSLNANPVELAALITAFAGTLFVILFSFRTDRLRAALPAKEKLDDLMYKTATVTFAMLAVLLITGAVWANESWGRYWAWDPKETGAFVAWLTYAAFLHTRISRGWTGRSSAYFALIAFLLIVFTYLGVSYLLPGLHSYA